MPGIVGIAGPRAQRQDAPAQLRTMMDCMLRESFYTSGSFVSADAGLAIGWVNHQESFVPSQPSWNATRDVCVAFSGEPYVDAATADRLGRSGRAFDRSDGSVLVHLYEALGTGFVESLNGRFSGVVADLRQNSAVLFNDRYGADRIYTHESDGTLFFSSEAKALLKLLPDLRQFDMTGLAELFSTGCALQNRTLFKGVNILPGASIWTAGPAGDLNKRTYFTPREWEQQPTLDGSEFCEQLNERFDRVLSRYLGESGKVAMSLTGGFDGRMIMAASHASPGTLPCYTFGSMYRDCTDVNVARRVAERCGQPHQTIVVGEDFFRNFPTLAEQAVYFSDGAMDPTGAVELHINKIARKIAPIRLTGNYGSEIVRGNVAFRPRAPKRHILAPDFIDHVTEAAGTYEDERRCHDVSFIAFKQVPWHHYSRLSIELSQLTMRAPFLDNEIVSLMYQAPPPLRVSNQPSFELIASGSKALSRIPTDRGLLYRPIPLITRLRNRYENFTFKAEYAYDYGMPQWLAAIDNVFRPLHLERLFLGRHKFYHFRVWYRDRLSDYVRDMLLDPRTRSRPYLNGSQLETIVDEHTSGKGNRTNEIHQVLATELIQRTLLEQS